MAAKYKLAAYQCQVIVISFGQREGAELWKADSNCEFDVYLDSERKLYKKFGMGRSVAKVWSRQSVSAYASAIIANISLPAPYADIEDDPLQMGGDIIFNSKEEPVITHLSNTPADRISVSQVLSFLQNTQP